MITGRLNYKAYKAGSQDIGRKGHLQQHLTTIEMGFAPFVPFTKKYVMAATSGPALGFGVGEGNKYTKFAANIPQQWKLMPQDLTDKPKGDIWPGTVRDWQLTHGGLAEAAERISQSDVQTKAAALSKAVSDLLSKVSIKGKYDTSQRGEIEDQSVIETIMEEMDTGKKWSSNVSARKKLEVTTKDGFDEMGNKETWDIAATSERNTAMLGHVYERLESKFGKGWTKRSIGIETTNMVREKYFQQKQKKYMEQGLSAVDAFKKSIHDSLKTDILDDINRIGNIVGKDWSAVQRYLSNASKGEGKKGYDTLTYMSNQIVNRIRRLEHSAVQLGENVYDSWIWEQPVSADMIGFAVITPILVDNWLDSFDVSVEVDTMTPGVYDWLGPNFSNIPSDPGFSSTFSNWLIQDAAVNLGLDRHAIESIASFSSQAAVDEMALNQQRGEMVGTVQATTVSAMLDATMGNLGVLGAVEVLSTKEVAKTLQEQVAGYLGGAQGNSLMAKVYEKAMADADDLTKSWKGNFPGKQSNQLFGPPYLSQKNMLGVGMPFWMTMGRDPFAFKAFQTWKERGEDAWTKKLGFNPKEAIIHKRGAAKKIKPQHVWKSTL